MQFGPTIGIPFLPSKVTVFAGGCFDWLHFAHIDFLQRARALGDVLVVGLNTDESIRMLKGPGRPLIPLRWRRESLLALRCVDDVVLIDDPLPIAAILSVRPQIVVKGPGYDPEAMPEREAVVSIGGRIVILDGPEGVSTTGLLRRGNCGTHQLSSESQ